MFESFYTKSGVHEQTDHAEERQCSRVFNFDVWEGNSGGGERDRTLERHQLLRAHCRECAAKTETKNHSDDHADGVSQEVRPLSLPPKLRLDHFDEGTIGQGRDSHFPDPPRAQGRRREKQRGKGNRVVELICVRELCHMADALMKEHQVSHETQHQRGRRGPKGTAVKPDEFDDLVKSHRLSAAFVR